MGKETGRSKKRKNEEVKDGQWTGKGRKKRVRRAEDAG